MIPFNSTVAACGRDRAGQPFPRQVAACATMSSSNPTQHIAVSSTRGVSLTHSPFTSTHTHQPCCDCEAPSASLCKNRSRPQTIFSTHTLISLLAAVTISGLLGIRHVARPPRAPRPTSLPKSAPYDSSRVCTLEPLPSILQGQKMVSIRDPSKQSSVERLDWTIARQAWRTCSTPLPERSR